MLTPDEGSPFNSATLMVNNHGKKPNSYYDFTNSKGTAGVNMAVYDEYKKYNC